jgi:hypothetical protein
MTHAGRVWRLALAAAVLTCFSVVGLAVVAASTSQAPASSPVVCPKLMTAISVDGRMDEWAGFPTVWLTAETAQYVSGAPAGAADASASLRCGWDTQWLYVLVDVSDNILLADSSTLWDDDGIEIAFDGDRDRACCGAKDHQFTIVLDSRLGDFGVLQGPSPLGWTVAPRLGGYVVEAAIPMPMILSGSPISGALLGFNWALNDDDDGGRRDKYLLWAGTTIQNYSLFGDLLLAGPLTSIPTATATPTATRTSVVQPTATPTTVSTATRTATATPQAAQAPTATLPPVATPTVTLPPAATPTTTGSPAPAERVDALERDVAGLGQVLRQLWDVMQAAGYLPGDAPPPTTATPTPLPTVAGYVQRVRCGGDAYTDGMGAVWAADQPYATGSWGYLGGLSYQTDQPIGGTLEDPLYQVERYNMAAYQFDLPPATYRVELRFAEIYQYAAANQRLFDVSLEGTKVITGLDLFTAAGPYTAYNRSFDVPVLDGQLNIDFAATKGAAKISAIKVETIGYIGPPPTPSLQQRVTNVEKAMTDLEQLLQQILSLFNRFLGL